MEGTYYTSYVNGHDYPERTWFAELHLADIMTMWEAKKIAEKITEEQYWEVYISIIELYYSDSVVSNYN